MDYPGQNTDSHSVEAEAGMQSELQDGGAPCNSRG